MLWVASILHEDRVKDELRQEIDERRGDLRPDSDDYWQLVASVAVEHITFDLIEQAKSSGVDLSSVDRGLGDEPPHQVGDNVH